MKTPELLSPAGSLKTMRYAFAFGADAVYAGQPRYSLRARNNEFMNDNLAIGIQEAKALGKQFFVAVNTMPHNSKVRTFIKDLDPIIKMQPDALIMADPGLIMMVKEKYPDQVLHLSVQASTVNYATARFWHQQGIKRVILSRELSLDEISEIRQECPDLELEVFVHGALCIAYSGRCLLSGYFNHRDPNQGTCTNSCRWQYKTHETTEDAENNLHQLPSSALDIANSNCGDQVRHPLADKTYFLEEKGRKGQFMPVTEDEHGTYIMNSKDLRAVEHIQRLTEIGVDCLKIEGRTKSHYYAARTAQVYRMAIDDAVAGREFNPRYLGILDNLASRGYTDGFFERHHTQDYQAYIENQSKSHQQQFVAEMIEHDKVSGQITFDVKNHFKVGDKLELIVASGNNKDFILDAMQNKVTGEAMDIAPGSGYQVQIKLPDFNEERAFLARYI